MHAACSLLLSPVRHCVQKEGLLAAERQQQRQEDARAVQGILKVAFCSFLDQQIAATPPPVLSTCYNHFIPIIVIVGVGKERRILINGPWRPVKPALVRNYLEVYWPRAGGLSAVNAIGTHLRDPIYSGLTRWRMAVS